MAITEPTGWELSCDSCGTAMDLDGADPGDQATLERWAREDDGWIVLMDYWHYCCLDCLLRHRRGAWVRTLHAGYASHLAEVRR